MVLTRVSKAHIWYRGVGKTIMGKRSQEWVRIKDRAIRENEKVGGLAVQIVT
jgi:hypothetical protein